MGYLYAGHNVLSVNLTRLLKSVLQQFSQGKKDTSNIPIFQMKS